MSSVWNKFFSNFREENPDLSFRDAQQEASQIYRNYDKEDLKMRKASELRERQMARTQKQREEKYRMGDTKKKNKKTSGYGDLYDFLPTGFDSEEKLKMRAQKAKELRERQMSKKNVKKKQPVYKKSFMLPKEFYGKSKGYGDLYSDFMPQDISLSDIRKLQEIPDFVREAKEQLNLDKSQADELTKEMDEIILRKDIKNFLSNAKESYNKENASSVDMKREFKKISGTMEKEYKSKIPYFVNKIKYYNDIKNKGMLKQEVIHNDNMINDLLNILQISRALKNKGIYSETVNILKEIIKIREDAYESLLKVY